MYKAVKVWDVCLSLSFTPRLFATEHLTQFKLRKTRNNELAQTPSEGGRTSRWQQPLCQDDAVTGARKF